MKIRKNKHNNGISMVDVTIAVAVVLIFTGVIGQIYYSIMLNNLKIRANAVVTYYIVKLAEDIDKMPYSEVTKQNLEQKISQYDCPDIYTITVEVENYQEKANVSDDLIKMVYINANYEVYNEEQNLTIDKLKIKEHATL